MEFNPKLALALCLSLAANAVQAKPRVLDPTSKWHVFYDVDSCRLARVFGSDKDEVILTFHKVAPEGALRPSIAGLPVKVFAGSRTGVFAAFGEGAKMIPVHQALPGTVGEDKRPLLMLGSFDLLNQAVESEDGYKNNLPPRSDQIAAIQHFKVSKAGSSIVFNMGPIGKALDALNNCTLELVKTWGLDPIQQAQLAQRPKPTTSPGEWLKSRDYPSKALFSGQSASIQFRLMVAKTGVPSACKVQVATRSPDFIDLTCKLLMERARFSPALDAAGQPQDSYYIDSVNWIMAGF